MKKNENILLVLSLVVMVALFLNLFNGPPREKWQELIYSDFVARVKAKEVVTANLNGSSHIEGGLIDGAAYRTNLPKDADSLIGLMRAQGVEISYTPDAGTPWYVTLLVQWGPFIFIFLIWIVFMRRMQGGPGGKLFQLGKSRANRLDPTKKRVTFKDVAGVQECKEDLEEIIDYLRDPAKFRRLGGRIPKGVLMSGSPGTGKTLLAKAVAGEAEVPFFSMSGSDFVEMFVGVGASRVRDLFEEGRKNAPCILFIDEIDAVGRSRGAGLGGGNDEREQTLNQLLVEMDGFDPTEGIIIIAATNRPDVLDPALLRPGRFDRQVHVPLPDIRGREQILKIHAAKAKIEEGVDLHAVAKGTPGFSGADLKNLVNEAALWAARRGKDWIGQSDFDQARDKILMGPERRSMVMDEKERETTAYHEAGHALVSALLSNTDPVHKVTIVPRGRALGMTSYLPDHDVRSYDVEYLQNRVAIAMGGRAAEELIYQRTTTGASNDIEQATETVRNMVCRWGMNEEMGPIVFDSEETNYIWGREIGKDREYSEDTAVRIDQEMRRVINEQYQRAIGLLRDNVDMLHRVARRLVEEETLDGKALMEMLRPAPAAPDAEPAPQA